MSRFKFVHAADLHLDSPFRGLEADGQLWPTLRRSTFDALDRLVALCLRERADLLLLAGDLFDCKDRSVRARLALRDAWARLDRAGVRTFVVHGNHDPLSATPEAIGLPPSVKVFGPELEEVEVLRDGALLCRIQGISYGQEEVRENLSRRFGRRGPGFTIGLMHANVGGNAGHANYAPCTLRDLDERELDYWALGHVHTRAEVRLPRGGLAAYPGNLQGRHVNEDGPRGALVVEVDQGRVETRFAALDAVRWHRLEVDLAPHAELEALLGACLECVERASAAEGPAAHVVRIELTGRGALHSELARPGGLVGFEEALRGQLSRTGRAVLLQAVNDGSRPELELEQVAAAGGLAGVVASSAHPLDPGLLDELWADEDLRRVDAILERLGLSSTRADGPRLVERAVLKAVEMLVEEGGP